MRETRFKHTEVGLIPEEWDVKAIGNLCKVNGRIGFRGYTKADLVPPGMGAYTIGGKHITHNILDLSDPEFISWEKYYESPEIMVHKGDIVMAQRGTLGRAAYIEEEIGPATINPSLVLLNRIKCNAKYLHLILSSEKCSEAVISSGSQTSVPMISQAQIEKIELQIPPTTTEQQSIAATLSDVDALIATTKKLIEKKRNIKEGAIHELLTGRKRLVGFSTTSKYKQFEYGEIPEDWNVSPLYKKCSLKARIGWQGLTTDEYLSQGDYILITGTDFKEGYINWNSCSFVDKWRYEQDTNIQIHKGDVLITKDGTIGKVAYLNSVPQLGTLNSGVFVVRPKNDKHLSNEYLSWLFKSVWFKDFIEQLSGGSTINHLFQRDFEKFQIVYPSDFKEQLAIANTLSSMDSEILSLNSRLTKFESVKQGMMQQLLTGKIRLI